eukprot:TRINITY_DN9919_c0_g2_i2.p5 TRINITY_DN9919_c0_g2~~TRINITY_DN9919_c0_g2_i2.p5  ORF type:complete len:129 (+),score=3.37 TRINITY_DN9919_c0_g2_i2:253-639(+)
MTFIYLCIKYYCFNQYFVFQLFSKSSIVLWDFNNKQLKYFPCVLFFLLNLTYQLFLLNKWFFFNLWQELLNYQNMDQQNMKSIYARCLGGMHHEGVKFVQIRRNTTCSGINDHKKKNFWNLKFNVSDI